MAYSTAYNSPTQQYANQKPRSALAQQLGWQPQQTQQSQWGQQQPQQQFQQQTSQPNWYSTQGMGFNGYTGQQNWGGFGANMQSGFGGGGVGQQNGQQPGGWGQQPQQPQSPYSQKLLDFMGVKHKNKQASTLSQLLNGYGYGKDGRSLSADDVSFYESQVDKIYGDEAAAMRRLYDSGFGDRSLGTNRQTTSPYATTYPNGQTTTNYNVQDHFGWNVPQPLQKQWLADMNTMYGAPVPEYLASNSNQVLRWKFNV